MAIKPPLRSLPIDTAESGFYTGFNQIVAVGSKILIGALILWAAVWSEQAGNVLKGIRAAVDANTGTWYMYCLLYTSPSPRDLSTPRMPSSA